MLIKISSWFLLSFDCLLDPVWSCLPLQTAYLLLTYIPKICLCLHAASCLWAWVLSSCTDNLHLKSQKHREDNYPDFCQSLQSFSESKLWWQQSKQGNAVICLLMSKSSWGGGSFVIQPLAVIEWLWMIRSFLLICWDVNYNTSSHKVIETASLPKEFL